MYGYIHKFYLSREKQNSPLSQTRSLTFMK